MKKIVPKTIWAERLLNLMWASGEHPREMCGRFGFEDRRALERILKGGHPKPEFVIRLRQLESLFEQDLAALKNGDIKIFPNSVMVFERVDLRGRRPQDRAQERKKVGQMGIPGEAISSHPFRTVRFTPEPRYRSNAGPGRSKIKRGGMELVIEGAD